MIVVLLVEPLKRWARPGVLVQDGGHECGVQVVGNVIEIHSRRHVCAVGLGVDVLPPDVSLDAGVGRVEDVDHIATVMWNILHRGCL